MVYVTTDWAKQSFGAGSIYTGLIYPIAVCVLTLLVGGTLVNETRDHRIDADVRGQR